MRLSTKIRYLEKRADLLVRISENRAACMIEASKVSTRAQVMGRWGKTGSQCFISFRRLADLYRSLRRAQHQRNLPAYVTAGLDVWRTYTALLRTKERLLTSVEPKP
jgi:hypothetical protein